MNNKRLQIAIENLDFLMEKMNMECFEHPKYNKIYFIHSEVVSRCDAALWDALELLEENNKTYKYLCIISELFFDFCWSTTTTNYIYDDTYQLLDKNIKSLKRVVK